MRRISLIGHTDRLGRNLSCAPPVVVRRQRGIALLVALVVLVAMSLAGIALLRSMDTGTVIAGNMAFKQGTLQAADLGVEQAFADLTGVIVASQEANVPAGCTNNCTYYATMQPLNSRGEPSTISWTSVPQAVVAGLPSGYSVQYVAERLCSGALPITDIQRSCMAELPLGGGSKRAGGTVFSASSTIYYRITVRVTGPRGAVTTTQTILEMS